MKFKQGIIAATLSIGLLIGSNPALANTPNDSSLIKLAQVTDLQQSFQDSMKHSFISAFAQGVLNSPVFRSLPMDKRAQAEVLAQTFGEQVWDELDTDLLTQQTTENFMLITKKHYSQQEVDAMVKFYQTPVGKSIVAKQSVVMNELLDKTLADFSNNHQFNQEVEQATKKHSPMFESQLQDLLR
ncbi:DUF2059 domain-containing protein [Moraxella nasibovis]|uniref:DUF2059 domain-containing protein n=1 Tax=Moraxella nasibovis TaxID=2904120 RepID=UPI00240F62E8|nr:DUF2059 domain-containing protein [Moraxella nasibovis]WFF38680.1 DUF2059 domain-containing protein [Moraxella nasibovis]